MSDNHDNTTKNLDKESEKMIESDLEKSGLQREICLLKSKLELQEFELQELRDSFQMEIAKRNRIETALREREEQLQLLFDNAPMGYQSLDSEGRFIVVNQAWLDILGYERSEVPGKWFGDFLHKDFVNAFRERFPVFKAAGKIHSEFKMIRKDGEEIFVAFEGRIGYRSNGKFKQTHCILKDISEQVKTEKALKESNELLMLFISKSPIYTYIKEVSLGESRVLYASENFSDMIGMPSSEMIGKTMQQMFSKEFAEEMTNDDFEVVSAGKIIKKEEVLNGRTFSTIKFPIVKNGRKLLAGYTIDITEKKLSEQALIKAERLNAIDEMLSKVAHGFNNDLQLVLGSLELIFMHSDLPKELLNHLTVAKKGATRAASSIRKLLYFTKKKAPQEFQSINLNKILEETINQLRPFWKDDAEKKGLQISLLKKFGDIKSIAGDQHELSNAFRKLIINSIEAMPSGGEITLETENVRGQVYVRIKDTGIGMSEEIKKRIFEPFFTTKGNDPSKGLGMSVVYSTIRNHDGEIQIKESGIGKGTTIEIRFPEIRKVEVVEEADDCSQDRCINILWVDDEVEIRNLVTRMIKNFGHNINAVGSGQEAIDFLEKNPCDLLISDVGMPGMSGWQLATKVKDKYKFLTIAIVTGHDTDDFSEQKDDFGVSYVLGKPLTSKELKDIINKTIKKIP